MKKYYSYTSLIIIILVFCLNIYSTESNTRNTIVSVDSTTKKVTGTLTWIGHASVKIKTREGVVIYIDPFAGSNSDYSEKADIILVTHGHPDHTQVGMVTKDNKTKIYSAKSADVGGTKMAIGDSVEVKGIKIKAVYAYNKNHKKGECAGFVLFIDGKKIYHSGDTSYIPEMAELAPLKLDYAMLCIDGVYNMGPKEAMKVAAVIKAKHVIPIHVAPPKVSEEEKQKNIAAFKPAHRLVMKEGETINF